MINKSSFIKIILILLLLCSFSYAGKIDIDKEIDSYLREREIANVSEIKVIDNVINGAIIIKIWADNSLYVKAIQHKRLRDSTDSSSFDKYSPHPIEKMNDRDHCVIVGKKMSDMDGNNYTFEELADELIEDCLHEDIGQYEMLVTELIEKMTELEHWPIVVNLIRAGVAREDGMVLTYEFERLAEFVLANPVFISEYRDLKLEFSGNIY